MLSLKYQSDDNRHAVEWFFSSFDHSEALEKGISNIGYGVNKEILGMAHASIYNSKQNQSIKLKCATPCMSLFSPASLLYQATGQIVAVLIMQMYCSSESKK